jgi:hypothetical protein
MVTPFSLFSMATEVPPVNSGFEVSQYVAEIFVKILVSFPEYGKKDYVQALDKTFMKIDELIDSDEGAKKLR